MHLFQKPLRYVVRSVLVKLGTYAATKVDVILKKTTVKIIQPQLAENHNSETDTTFIILYKRAHVYQREAIYRPWTN